MTTLQQELVITDKQCPVRSLLLNHGHPNTYFGLVEECMLIYAPINIGDSHFSNLHREPMGIVYGIGDSLLHIHKEALLKDGKYILPHDKYSMYEVILRNEHKIKKFENLGDIGEFYDTYKQINKQLPCRAKNVDNIRRDVYTIDDVNRVINKELGNNVSEESVKELKELKKKAGNAETAIDWHLVSQNYDGIEFNLKESDRKALGDSTDTEYKWAKGATYNVGILFTSSPIDYVKLLDDRGDVINEISPSLYNMIKGNFYASPNFAYSIYNGTASKLEGLRHRLRQSSLGAAGLGATELIVNTALPATFRLPLETAKFGISLGESLPSKLAGGAIGGLLGLAAIPTVATGSAYLSGMALQYGGAAVSSAIASRIYEPIAPTLKTATEYAATYALTGAAAIGALGTARSYLSKNDER